jgi:hypothetical protein
MLPAPVLSGRAFPPGRTKRIPDPLIGVLKGGKQKTRPVVGRAGLDMSLVAHAPAHSHSFASTVPVMAGYHSAVMVARVSVPPVVVVMAMRPDIDAKFDGIGRSRTCQAYAGR